MNPHRLAVLFGLLALALPAAARDTAVLESLLVAQRCAPRDACAFTYTLATITGEAFDLVEERIGPRDAGFLLLGAEFTDNGAPGSWFPNNKNQVVIQLTRDAMRDEKRALFQLAHEVFHVHSPTRGVVNVLEEGLATEFSLDFVRSRGIDIDEDYIASPTYRAARAAVACLRGYEPGLNAQLKQLRASGTRIGLASSAQLAGRLRNAPRDLVEGLATPFDRIKDVEGKLRQNCQTTQAGASR